MTSRAGYFLAPIPLLAGLAVAGWLAWSAVAALQNALTRFVAPGTVALTLDEPGGYTIFHEPDSVVDGKLYSAQNVAGLRVRVAAESDGRAIPVEVPNVSSSYSIGGHSGKSALAFDIVQPGHYRLTADYGGAGGPQTVLAVGRAIFKRLFSAIFGAIGAVFVGCGLALALVLTTYFRRRRMVRAASG